jgi:hypothetical protein
MVDDSYAKGRTQDYLNISATHLSVTEMFKKSLIQVSV